MNKHFFLLILFICVSQLSAMDGFYPHNYRCDRHRHIPSGYPYAINMSRIGKAMNASGEWGSIQVYESDDRAFDQFEDGKAPLVIARRAFEGIQFEEFNTLKQQANQAAATLCRELATDECPLEGDTITRRNLRERLANPNTNYWVAKLESQPEIWKAVEKMALTANIFGSKQPHYFKHLLLPIIAKHIDAVFFAQGTKYVEQINQKDATIAQERLAKQNAEAQLADAAAQVRANQDVLTPLEAGRETFLRTMRQRMGRTAYNGQFVELAPAYAQIVAAHRENPPADQIQILERELSAPELDPLYNLIIKTAQVRSHQNAKALIISIMAHLRFVTNNAFACPVIERLNQANAQLEEQRRKSQADLEAAHKAKADLEMRKNQQIEELQRQKRELAERFERDIRQLGVDAEQRNEHARATLRALRGELSPLRRELPRLREESREQQELIARQNIQIQTLNQVLAARTNQP